MEKVIINGGIHIRLGGNPAFCTEELPDGTGTEEEELCDVSSGADDPDAPSGQLTFETPEELIGDIMEMLEYIMETLDDVLEKSGPSDKEERHE